MNYNRDVDPLFATTTPISTNSGRDGGTGFFLNYDDSTYLVTNRHVLNPDSGSVTEFRIWFRDHHDITSVVHEDIDIAGGDGTDWFGHFEGTDVDLALVPLNRRLSTLDELYGEGAVTGSLAFTRDWYIPEAVRIESDVSIFGYPGGLMDTQAKYPVRRKALISSPYGGLFDGEMYFLTDAKMHRGTSGSPVIMNKGLGWSNPDEVPENRTKRAYILGVHSAELPPEVYSPESRERWVTGKRGKVMGEKNRELDLNIAWYPEAIDAVFVKMEFKINGHDELAQNFVDMTKEQRLELIGELSPETRNKIGEMRGDFA